jgi:ADP-ribosylglycohydrolase
MKNKLRDIIYGFAIGDALGVPVEFFNRLILERYPVTDMREFGTYNQPKGSWSDDTSLTLCLLDAISFKNRTINTKQVAKNMINWMDLSDFTANDIRFDIGNSTRKAIENMKNNLENPCLAGDVDGKGNGSLMRISPLILFTLDMTKEELFKFIKDIGYMTHQNELCFLCSYFYILFAQNLLHENNKEVAFDKTIEEFKKEFSEHKEFFNFERILNKTIFFPNQTVYSSGFVSYTLEAAIYCLMETNNYKSAVLKAVNLGEDTDTIAAITGSLAGILYGYDNIPKEWIDSLLNKELIDKTIEKSFE